MLLFGSINNGGANYWQKPGIITNSVELNLNEVTSLAAQTPSATRYIINTDDAGNGASASGAYSNDGQLEGANVLVDDRINGGVYGPFIAGAGISNTSIITINANNPITPITLSSTNNTQTENVNCEINYQNFSLQAYDGSFQSGFFLTKLSCGFEFFDNFNALKGFYRWNVDIMEVEDANNHRVFGVRTNGEIQTNQAIPHNNTINTLTWDLPIHDINGNLLGYIKVYT